MTLARVGRVLAGTAVGALLTLGVVGLSRVPWSAEDSEDPVLRLAWRYRSEEVEACRDLTAEEQARLPAHMRRTRECTRGLASYRLKVTVDGIAAADDSVFARGAQSDRPLAVFRELSLKPGSRHIAVVFGAYGAAQARFRLDTVLTLEPRQVVVA
ncbi:MAG TPA: hypothetical protein VNL98_05680, partial [Gemmatimonadales bacterium]|nr:hypothetical protein [Gemmatimonadales bacterium]